tara:strand:- start:1021 stop:1227 length:207 start_codon:yes stop_codon:yes gene_type:complete
MEKNILPLAAMERLLKKYGAERVSEDAKEELREVLEDVAEQVTQEAVKFAAHAHRKTIRSSDVKLASK